MKRPSRDFVLKLDSSQKNAAPDILCPVRSWSFIGIPTIRIRSVEYRQLRQSRLDPVHGKGKVLQFAGEIAIVRSQIT